MQKDKTTDLTNGSPIKVILLFALPMLLGNMLQQLYAFVDTMIVGHNLGDDALASMGATGILYSLVIGLANGMNNGCGIIVAKYFGAKRYDKMRNAISLTLVINACSTVIFTAGGMIFLKPMMRLLNTPEKLMERSYSYMSVIMLGILVTLMYNMLSGILRAIGNSKVPLYFLIVSSTANVLLDLLFILVFKLDVRGAAIATVLSQLISVALCAIYIITKCPIIHISGKDFVFDKAMLGDLVSMGLSMGMISSLVSIGSVALQGSVNKLGETVITAHTSARRLCGIFMLPLSTLGAAISTFVGQNYGAGKQDRIKKALFDTLIAGCVWSLFGIVVMYIFGSFFVKLQTGTSDSEVIRTAVKYIRINMPFYFPLAALFLYRGTLQGLGKKAVPIISAVIELVGKFAAVAVLAPSFYYLGICIAEPIIWTASAIVVIIVFYRTKLTQKNTQCRA